MIKTCIGLHVKHPFFLSDIHEPEFSGQIFEKYSNIKLKIRPVGAELYHADVRTDTRTDEQT